MNRIEYLVYAKEVLNDLIKEEYPELTDTQTLLLNHYSYLYKLNSLLAVVYLGGKFSNEDHFKDLIKAGLHNFLYDQSEEVIDTIKELGNNLDNNFNTLKSMLLSKEIKSEEKNTDKEICNSCFKKSGITCCMHYGCELQLEDIKEEYRNLEGIKKLLDTGLVVIDKWESDEMMDETYFLRLKNIYDGNRKVNFSWGGCCILLGKDGCMLGYDQRPNSGRTTIPKGELAKCANETKVDNNNKFLSAKSFKPLQDELEEIVYSIYAADRYN